ncbi:MAG: PD-(D/E)XK nuclease family protein, partial [Bacteroidia bacterium]|nr:PD-(D/E)XK nuclease family protein [Bacteroidia bacterium]
TMGYPFAQTPLYSFLTELAHLQTTSRSDSTRIYCQKKKIQTILLHPWIAAFQLNESSSLSSYLNQLFLPEVLLSEIQQQISHPLLHTVFQQVTDSSQLFEQILDLIEQFRVFFLVKRTNIPYSEDNQPVESIQNQEVQLFIPELEYLLELHKKITLLKDCWVQYALSTNLSLTWKVILEALQTTKIRFSGEPVSGLQIMGLLESRLLDFDKILILSMNEGSISGQPPRPSFIPYHLRKAYSLPTIDEHDSQIAYSFYRLLHHPTEIHFFYHSATEKGSGERSRFIEQLAHELKPNLKGTWQENQVILSQPISDKLPIALTVNDKQKSLWLEKFPKGISATAIYSFLSCKLQFALRYYSGILIEESLDDEIHPGLFGQLTHQLLYTLYLPFLKYKTPLQKLTTQEIPMKMSTVLNQVLQLSTSKLTGKNYLLVYTIQNLVEKVIQHDKSNKRNDIVVGLEKRVSTTIETKKGSILLRGVIDRIDKTAKDEIEILDYKTAEIRTVETSAYEQVLEPGRNFVSLQLIMYAWMWLRNQPDDCVRAGVYPLRKFDNSIRWVNPQPIQYSDLQGFEQRLITVIEEMFNPEQVLEQTENIATCKICEFAGICGRQ